MATMNKFAIIALFSSVIMFTLAVFVLRKDWDKKVRLTFFLFNTCGAFWIFNTFILCVLRDKQIAWIWKNVCYSVVAFMPSLFSHLLFTILGEEKNRKNLIKLSYLISACFSVVSPTKLFVSDIRPLPPYFNFVPSPGPAFHLFIAFFYGLVGYAHYRVWIRWKTATGHTKTQLSYVLLGFVVGLIGITIFILLVYGINVEVCIPHDLVTLSYSFILSYAIVRHQLMDIEVIVKQTVVYSLLAALITAAYLVMVLIMERWFQGFLGYRSVVATVIVAFLIAIFFNPLRTRIQAFVDRTIFQGTPVELAAQRDQLLVEVRKNEQQKAIATLAAGLAHEIKNPLTAIKTFTDHLGSRYDDPTFREKFTRIVGGEVERIHLIVQRLLEFAKPLPPRLTSVNIPTLLDETLEFLSSELVQRRVEVQRSYDAHGQVLGDPQQLKQVFLNLLLNGLQAMNGAGWLNLQTEVRDGELVVTIQDNGSGIAASDLPHIFEPFFTTKPTGTGLGLAVVQGIIQEHHGRITIESHPGSGTSVRMTLPVTT